MMWLKNDESIRKQMAENIVLSGGNAGFKGLKERLNKELNEYEDINLNLDIDKLKRINHKFDVKCSDNPKYNVFIGASIYGELIYENEPSLFMYKEEYMNMVRMFYIDINVFEIVFCCVKIMDLKLQICFILRENNPLTDQYSSSCLEPRDYNQMALNCYPM